MAECDYLKPFEFETDKKPTKRGIDGLLADIDQDIRVMDEWARSNNIRMAKVRYQQNLIKGMGCLP